MKKETSQSPGSAQDRKMSKGELISYGLGGVASTMPSQFKTSYAMNFMSDVAGLHVGAVGVLNTLLIIWDAINDPIIGGIADRTNTKRFGKYLPHMIMGVLLWAVIMVMLFTVPWQALNSAMTRDPQERNLMLTCRQYGGFIAGAVVGIITMPIVERSANPKTGWLISVGIVCIVMVITGLCAANGAKRVDYYNSLPTPEKVHLKSQLHLITKNRAVICAALLLGTVTLVNTTSSAISLYYLRCVVENVALKSIFSIVSLLISLIFIPMMPAVLKKVGKIKTVLYGMALIVLPAIWLMIRLESMSDLKVVASSFCSSFSTTIVGVALAAVGYSADSVSQEVIDMIINIKIIYPFILLIVTGLILHFYPITPEFARKMRAELKERRTAAAAAKQA